MREGKKGKTRIKDKHVGIGPQSVLCSINFIHAGNHQRDQTSNSEENVHRVVSKLPPEESSSLKLIRMSLDFL